MANAGEMKEGKMDIFKTAGTLADIANKLRIIDVIKAKLFTQPDEANKYLRIVLGEIGRFYEGLDMQVSKLLSTVAYEGMPDETKNLMLQRLTELDSSSVKLKLEETRGSSQLIYILHAKFLNPWFQSVVGINAKERKEIADMFRALDEFDGVLLKSMDEMATWIGNEAEKAHQMIKVGKYDEASKIIDDAREEVKDLRRKSVDLIKKLYDFNRNLGKRLELSKWLLLPDACGRSHGPRSPIL